MRLPPFQPVFFVLVSVLAVLALRLGTGSSSSSFRRQNRPVRARGRRGSRSAVARRRIFASGRACAGRRARVGRRAHRPRTSGCQQGISEALRTGASFRSRRQLRPKRTARCLFKAARLWTALTLGQVRMRAAKKTLKSLCPRALRPRVARAAKTATAHRVCTAQLRSRRV